MFRCETTALFTSRSSRNRSRSRASSRCIASGALVVQDVVDGDRDLLGHLLHEGDLVFLVFVLLEAPESHGAQAAERRRQRHCTERLHAVLAQARDDGGEPVLERDVVDDQRLLCLPDEAAGRFVDRELGAWLDGRVNRRGKQVQPHHVAGRIVQHHIDVVEGDDRGGAAGRGRERVRSGQDVTQWIPTLRAASGAGRVRRGQRPAGRPVNP